MEQMQKLIINELGPISHCELEIEDFMVFTGSQASGKSTVAKSIFFFKTIRNLLFTEMRKRYFFDFHLEKFAEISSRNQLIKAIRANFLQTFGTMWHMERTMCLQYHYTEDVSIKITLKQDVDSPNYIWIDFSPKLVGFLDSLNDDNEKNTLDALVEVALVKRKIDEFFGDDSEMIYIPAGRSRITLLSTQLNYIYSVMDDSQKRSLDYCTQDYLERILRIKPEFSVTIAQMIRMQLELTDIRLNKAVIYEAAELMREILKGEYRNVDGEERLQVSENKYVKINFASSGQQEAVWILNVLFNMLLKKQKGLFYH